MTELSVTNLTVEPGEPVARVKMGGLTIADVYTSQREPVDQNETAALFAAAPELLQHLTRLVAALDRMPSNPADGLADEARAAIERARAAIDRATASA